MVASKSPAFATSKGESGDRASGPRAKRHRSPWLVIALTCLWLASVGNLALWRALARLPELDDLRGLAFGVGFGVGIAALIGLLLSVLAWRWTLKPALLLCLFAAAVGGAFMLVFGAYIDPSMMVSALLTDTREMRELLGVHWGITALELGVLPMWLVLRTPIAWPGTGRQASQNAMFLIACSALLAGVLSLFFQDLSSTMRNHTQLRFLINPLNSFWALATLGESPLQHNGAAVLPMGRDARLPAAAPGSRPPLVLMVVGETARADHLGLNGYARDTTPQLAREGVVSLRNVWSCGTSTAASVPCMFSPLGREAFDQRKENTEGLADVLEHAGYAVLWLDNQAGGCKGVCDRVPTVEDRELSHPSLCAADGECPDEVMLRGLDERIARLPAERRARGVIVFMHQMGSHGPAYFKRAPAAFKQYLPECTSDALQRCSREEIINAYDNTIVYTDEFLASGIDWLKKHEDQWAPALVYVSDHGESLGENNLYLHGLPYSIAPDVQKHVPWIFWLSPRFERQTHVTLACLRARVDQPLSHDNYFHTTLGLLGVRTSIHDERRDITTRCQSPSDSPAPATLAAR